MWETNYPFPQDSLLELSTTLLRYIHTLNDNCNRVRFVSSSESVSQKQPYRALEASFCLDFDRSSHLLHSPSCLLPSVSSLVLVCEHGWNHPHSWFSPRACEDLHNSQLPREASNRLLLSAGRCLLLFSKGTNAGLVLHMEAGNDLLPRAVSAVICGHCSNAVID